jgi:hypothetical protein
MKTSVPKFYVKRPGQCFRIRVGDRGFAMAQYVLWTKNGPLFRLNDNINNSTADFAKLIGVASKYIIIGGILGALKKGWWTYAGRLPVSPFEHPKFRFSFGIKPGVYHDWKIWDGTDMKFIGELPVDLQNLEFLCGWSPQALEKRLLTGKNRFDEVL